MTRPRTTPAQAREAGLAHPTTLRTRKMEMESKFSLQYLPQIQIVSRRPFWISSECLNNFSILVKKKPVKRSLAGTPRRLQQIIKMTRPMMKTPTNLVSGNPYPCRIVVCLLLILIMNKNLWVLSYIV